MHSCTCSEYVELYEGVPELVTNNKLYTPVTPTMMDALQQQTTTLKKSKLYLNIYNTLGSPYNTVFSSQL